ncbi:hypothetical protein HDU87_004347 [Geranomyces variabilis]|uniref:Uncharacterized protein n=1 Tax=Geranomyces variabilis TaxID=109894 RepID=A0AAD5TIV0_9FUNG|nr:hypothetical protein HDU87_004347 [Geranomyces variabilis]
MPALSTALSAAGVAVLALAASSANAAKAPATLEHVIAFGDSYSDNGNTFKVTGYPAAPYFNGRYSNGPTWAELVANATVGNSNFTDVAYGGAYASKAALSPPQNLTAGEFDPPDLTQQLQYYLGNHTKYPHPRTTLYTLFAGGNDYVNPFQAGNKPDANKVAGAIVSFVQALHESPLNATDFLILDMFDFADLPVVRQAAAQAGNATGTTILAGATALSNGHNQVLAAGFAGLTTKTPALKIRLVDFYSLAKASSTNFKNGTSPCVTLAPNATASATYRSTDPKNVIACQDPDSYWYWDDQHPTAAGHKMIADLALKTLADPSAIINGTDGSRNKTSPTGGDTGKNGTQGAGHSGSKSAASTQAYVFGSGAAVLAAVVTAFFAL